MSTGLCRGGAEKKSALQAYFVAIKVHVMSFSFIRDTFSERNGQFPRCSCR